MDKTFLNLVDGDEIYVINYAVHGVPQMTNKKIRKVVHRGHTTTFFMGREKYSVDNEETSAALISTIGTMCEFISTTKEESLKRYKCFIEDVIKRKKMK